MTKISQQLATKIAKLEGDNFHIGVVRELPVDDIARGKWAHLGISVEDGQVVAAEPSVLPEPSAGRYSKWNVEGREIVRDDLPKVTRSWVIYVYPYGQTDRSQVPAYQSREVFPRELIHGKAFRIELTVQHDAGATQARLGFRVDRVFAKATEASDPDLVLAAGLLRENVGSVDVVSTDVSPEEWVAYRELGWELLPPGLKGPQLLDALIERLNQAPGGALPGVATERLRAVLALHPAQVVVGTGRLDRYVAYVFRDDLAVLENLTYGNALYVMYENWEQTTQRSRLELLAGPQTDFTRIVHSGDWVTLLREAVHASRWRNR